MSHQTGATILALSAHTIVLIPRMRAMVPTQIAYMQTPVFHCLRTVVIRGIRTNRKARRFATGTRGKVESIFD